MVTPGPTVRRRGALVYGDAGFHGSTGNIKLAQPIVGMTILWGLKRDGDVWSGGEILDLLRGSVRDYGQTLVMVTHDARAAATADRILFIADGLIVKELRGADEHEVLAVVEEIALR
jgi:hypothetical protein